MKIKILLSALVFIFLFSFVVIPGQSAASDALSIFPDNISSVRSNPAAMGGSPHNIKFQLDPVKLKLWNNAWTARQIVDNINAYLDDDIKKDILDSVKGDAWVSGFNMDSSVIFEYNPYSVHAGLHGNLDFSLDKEIFELILEGVKIDLDLELDNTSARSDVILAAGFSGVFPLEDAAEKYDWESLYAGAGVNYLHGLAWMDVDTDAKVRIPEEGEYEEEVMLEGEGLVNLLHTDPEQGGGQGYALDLGIWGQLTDELAVGVGLSNLGMMQWDGVRNTRYDGEFILYHPAFLEEDDEILDADYDEILDVPHEQVTVRNPVSLRGDILYDIHRDIDVIASIGYSEAPVDNYNLSVGSRFYHLQWMPITVIMDYASHKRGVSLSGSLSLKSGSFDLLELTVSDLKLWSGDGVGGSVMLSTGLRF